MLKEYWKIIQFRHIFVILVIVIPAQASYFQRIDFCLSVNTVINRSVQILCKVNVFILRIKGKKSELQTFAGK